MKVIKFIILLAVLSAFDKRDKIKEFVVLTAIGDTAYLFKNDIKETFYVFNIEPSCTGCKNNLAKELIHKKNVVVVTNYYPYIEDRKVTQKYFSGTFTNAKHIYFLPALKQSLNIQKLNSRKMPCVIWYSPKNKSYTLFNYDDIFEETIIKKNFKRLLKE